MFQKIVDKEYPIAVIGLGYVGLPLALAFARKFKVIGFDISAERVAMMRDGEDPSKELEDDAFLDADIFFTSKPEDLAAARFYVIAVPTPVDQHKVPNLAPVLAASHTVGRVLKEGDYVIYESTVYPGCTEEDCLPILERESGLTLGQFKLGYSPERINPGDKERTLERITKIVSGNDPEALDVIAATYGSVITAGVYPASSIKVAEAAKVIENAQRDINIAFVNELAIIFDRMNIDTGEVLKAAGTKWNFLPFQPGLVGGHCIGVDPYYLAYKAQKMGYDPQIILAGRRLNDSIPGHIAKKLVQYLIGQEKNPADCKVLVMGITFKENVSDIRNSKVADLIHEIKGYSVAVDVVDPHASGEEVMHEYDIELSQRAEGPYDAVVVAVNHDAYKSLSSEHFKELMNGSPTLIDIKGMYSFVDPDLHYWRL